MKIKLNKLILNNFKKVKELTVDFNGLNLNVYGESQWKEKNDKS